LGKVSYAFGDYDFTFTGGTNRVSGKRSRVSLKSILVLHGKSPSAYRNRPIALTNWALFRRDRFVCAYCGAVTRHLTRDHIVPMSRGGDDSWTNCCAACTSCNTRKGSHLLEELGWQLLYVPYVPNHYESLILLNRNILADQMDFLVQMVPKSSRIALRPSSSSEDIAYP
jgi:5-methylcytosine-specific restriction endonuclease McrA